MNQGLDEANEGSREIGKPVGKLMNIPTSIMRGGAEGIKSKKKIPEIHSIDNPIKLSSQSCP